MNVNTTANHPPRESAGDERLAGDADRAWRLVGHDGSSVEIASHQAGAKSRAVRAVSGAVRAVRHPLEFQPVAGVSLSDLQTTTDAELGGTAKLEETPHRQTPTTPVTAAPSTTSGQISGEARQELVEMIQCWQQLSGELRAAILSLVRAAR